MLFGVYGGIIFWLSEMNGWMDSKLLADLQFGDGMIIKMVQVYGWKRNMENPPLELLYVVLEKVGFEFTRGLRKKVCSNPKMP